MVSDVVVTITSPHFGHRIRTSRLPCASFIYSVNSCRRVARPTGQTHWPYPEEYPYMTLTEARKIVEKAIRIVAFTGAGISTESGIPDFRSPGGVWSNNRIVEYDEFLNDRDGRIEYWQQKVAMWPEMRDAMPNPGHLALVELERRGKLQTLITQNIDGLHQKAGSRNVIELHGTTTRAECQTCHQSITMDEAVTRIENGEPAPECEACGGLLKPATISFGQALSERDLSAAVDACRKCDLMIAIGSSLVVQPAASLPQIAKKFGAALFIINRTTTPLDHLADLTLRDQIGQVLPDLVSTDPGSE